MQFKKLFISDSNYIDFENAKIVTEAREFTLTETELYFLECLSSNVNKLVRYEAISKYLARKKNSNGQIYDEDLNNFSRESFRTLANHIRNYDKNNIHIKSQRGLGYILEVPEYLIEKSQQNEQISITKPDLDTNENKKELPPKRLHLTKKAKISTTLISLVLIITIAIGTIFGITSNNSIKTNPKYYHISISKPALISENDINILEDRIKIFSNNSKYSMDITETKIELYLPVAAFAENDVDYVLNAYLIRPIELYAINSETNDLNENIHVSRDDIEEVKVLDGPIEGIDAAEYGVGTENYKYFSLKLNDSFVAENESLIEEFGRNFLLAQDISNEGFYYYYTFPQNDGKTFYILNNDTSENFVKLFEYNLTHECLSVNLNDYVVDINSKTTWQDISSTNTLGENQCNFDDFQNGTITFSYLHYGTLSDGEMMDTERGLKQRLDILGNKYAFGTYSGNDNVYYVVKTTIDNINLPILNILSNSVSIKIRGKLSEYELSNVDAAVSSDSISFIQNDLDYYNLFEKEDFEAFVNSLNDSNEENIYIMVNNMPLLSTNIGNIDTGLGQITFDKICHMEKGKIIYSDITDEYSYILNLLAESIKNDNMESLSLVQYQFNSGNNGKIPSENQFNLIYDFVDEELIGKIKEICPTASCGMEDLELYISLNLPIDDNFVNNSLDLVKKIYETVDIDNSILNGITIYLVEENDSVMERGRIFFNKSLETSYSEGYIRVSGIFVNGRLEQYKNEFQNAVTNNEFLKNFQQDSTSWTFTAFNS